VFVAQKVEMHLLKSWHYDTAKCPVVLVKKKKLKAEMLNRVLAMAGRKVGPSTGG